MIDMRKYIQSEEQYKGYILRIVMTCLDDRRMQYHRSCEAYHNEKRVAIGKTKKEMKKLIDGGYVQYFESKNM